MKSDTWTHQLEEWAVPRTTTAVALAGLVVLALGIVLLALGGVALSQSPQAFDLWVVAIGLYVLAGAMIGIGRAQDRPASSDRPRSFSDHASLAEAPALSAPPSDDAFSARRIPPSVRPRGASDTIAGQYAEAARLRAGRSGPRRSLSGSDGDSPLASGYPYSPLDRGIRDPTGSSFPGTRAELEAEIEQLRARVSELEGGRKPAGSAVPAYLPSSHWPGPSVCVGCGAALVGGPDDSRCAQCGRPLCAQCFAAVQDGPEAHECPECRGEAGKPASDRAATSLGSAGGDVTNPSAVASPVPPSPVRDSP